VRNYHISSGHKLGRIILQQNIGSDIGSLEKDNTEIKRRR